MGVTDERKVIRMKKLKVKRTLKPGDKVVMNNKYRVLEKNKGVIWTVASEPWDVCGSTVVKLEGKTGSYAVDGLDLVEEAKGDA